MAASCSSCRPPRTALSITPLTCSSQHKPEFTRAAIYYVCRCGRWRLLMLHHVPVPPPHASPRPAKFTHAAVWSQRARHRSKHSGTQRPGSCCATRSQQYGSCMEGLRRERCSEHVAATCVAFELASGCIVCWCADRRPHLSGDRVPTNDSAFALPVASYRVIVVWCWSSVVHRSRGLRASICGCSPSCGHHVCCSSASTPPHVTVAALLWVLMTVIRSPYSERMRSSLDAVK
jgi:hypothetical protein